MEKLTIEELAPYLGSDTIGIYRLGDIAIDMNERFADEKRYKKLTPESCDFFFKFCKPLLYPLSHLTNEDDNGLCLLEKIIRELPGYCDAYDEWLDAVLGNFCIEERIMQAPYELVQYLISKKYDVFNLIGQGKAEDVTKLETNPYEV